KVAKKCRSTGRSTWLSWSTGSKAVGRSTWGSTWLSQLARANWKPNWIRASGQRRCPVDRSVDLAKAVKKVTRNKRWQVDRKKKVVDLEAQIRSDLVDRSVDP